VVGSLQKKITCSTAVTEAGDRNIFRREMRGEKRGRTGGLQDTSGTAPRLQGPPEVASRDLADSSQNYQQGW